MARGEGDGAAEDSDARIPDDALAEQLEEEVSQISARLRSPLDGLSDDELVEALSAEMASTGDTLRTITELQGVLAARRQRHERRGAHASDWIPPAAFLQGPAVSVPVELRPQGGGAFTGGGTPGEEPPPASAEDAATRAGGALDPSPSSPVRLMPSASGDGGEAAPVSSALDVVDDADALDERDPGQGMAPRSMVSTAAFAGGDDGTRPQSDAARVGAPAVDPARYAERTGRPVRMLWFWFAATSSLTTAGVGASLAIWRLDAAELLVAILGGIALSAVLLWLGSTAGARTGRSTMVLSRFAYGAPGNVVTAVLAVVVQSFWAIASVWFIGVVVADALERAGLAGRGVPAGAAGTGAAIVVAGLVAVGGRRLVVSLQLVITGCSAAALVLALLATAPRLLGGAGSAATRIVGGPPAGWIALLSCAGYVFAFAGLAWANRAADPARSQRSSSSTSAVGAWAIVGGVLAPALLLGYGAAIALVDPDAGARLAADPAAALLDAAAPAWTVVPVALALVLPLMSQAVLGLSSAGLSIIAAGLRLRRRTAVGAAVAIAVVGAAWLWAMDPGFVTVFRALPLTIGVPVAAWSGTFASEIVIRRGWPADRVLRAPVRGHRLLGWGNLVALAVASVLGFGLIREPEAWLGWQGYLLPRHAGGGTAPVAVGVLVALAVGALAPLVLRAGRTGRSRRAASRL